MGNSLAVTDNNYYIYRRKSSNDCWEPIPIITFKNISEIEALSTFKHEIYCFGLENSKYVDTKAIYLYHGRTRVSKAIINSQNKQLEIWSSAIRQYIQCGEQSHNPGKTIKYERLFRNKFQANYVWLDSQRIGFALHK
tara:strand:+ start:67 stop:480 length:414 start_codon:yes stop_codon:yes gene_type:complete